MQNRLFKILSILVAATLLLSACSAEEKRVLLIDTYEPNNFTVACVDLSLQSPDNIKVGEGFTAIVKITNTCNETIVVSYGLDGDLLITQTDGKVLWQHYQGFPIQSPELNQTLTAGESFEPAVYTWDGRDWQNKILTTGSYNAVVKFGISTDAIRTLDSVKSFKITN